jgi:hypothetical protein
LAPGWSPTWRTAKHRNCPPRYFGFYPGEPIYFYANPWPFEADNLVDRQLPGGARWHEEGWQGTMLPYADVAGDPEAEERLLSYFGEVYKVASPTLLA